MSTSSSLNKVSSLVLRVQRPNTTSRSSVSVSRQLQRHHAQRLLRPDPIRTPPMHRHIPVPHIYCRNSSALRWNSSSTDAAQDHQQQQLPSMMDAFSVLKLERKFDVSPEELKQSYRQLMATLHPDKHNSKPLNEQEDLQQQASQVTQAYQILKDIPARATHMLQLLGRIDADADDVASDNDEDSDQSTSKRIAGMEDSTLHDLLGESSQETSMMLLMEVMELREAIEEASGDEELLQKLLEDNSARMNDVYEQLTHAFSTTTSTGAARAPDLDKALKCTVMMQYYNRIDETIRDKMDQ